MEGRVVARLGWVGQTTDFFEYSLSLMISVSSWAYFCHWSTIFNSFNVELGKSVLGVLKGRHETSRIELIMGLLNIALQ